MMFRSASFYFAIASLISCKTTNVSRNLSDSESLSGPVKIIESGCYRVTSAHGEDDNWLFNTNTICLREVEDEGLIRYAFDFYQTRRILQTVKTSQSDDEVSCDSCSYFSSEKWKISVHQYQTKSGDPKTYKLLLMKVKDGGFEFSISQLKESGK